MGVNSLSCIGFTNQYIHIPIMSIYSYTRLRSGGGGGGATKWEGGGG